MNDAPFPKRRVATPTILQMERSECGAVALTIVLAYHGRNLPIEQLRVDCGVSRDGSSVAKILSAARAHHLDAEELSLRPQEVTQHPLPLILSWQFHHFLVLEGYDAQFYYLNDPYCGPRKVSHADFEHSFSGTALAFTPGEGFKPGGHPPSPMPALKRRLKGLWLDICYILCATLLLVVPGLAIPIFSKIFIDNVLIENHLNWMPALRTAMVLALFLQMILTWIQQRAILQLTTKMALLWCAQFISHLLSLPIEFFEQRWAGDISARVQSNNRLSTLLGGTVATNIVNLLTAFIYAIVMYLFDAWLATSVVVLALINAAVLKKLARLRADEWLKNLQDQGKIAGTSVAGIRIIDSLKASAGEDDFFSVWSGYQAKLLASNQRLGTAAACLDSLTASLTLLSQAFIIGLGGLSIINGNLSVGDLIAFQSLAVLFMTPINQLVSFGQRLQEASGDLVRLEDIFNNKPSVRLVEPLEEFPPITALCGELRFEKVTFGYNRQGPPLIENFDLVIAPGRRVALVGGSGSGKTTISKLAIGLMKPWSGSVLIDGHPFDHWPRKLLARSRAYVDQSIGLFAGTVSDNLRMWDQSTPIELVIEAARDACIHEDIVSRGSLGYESEVKSGGSNFSGGQRQRIEIARALVHRPKLLILDEATSALDPLTEQRLDASLRRRGCACLIVAHRLSTIRDCDEIIYLEGGKVKERGTHEELMELGQSYAALIKDDPSSSPTREGAASP